MACRLSNGFTDSSPRGRPPCKDKKQTLTVKNVIESAVEVAVSAGCSKSTAQRVLTADLGMSHVSATTNGGRKICSCRRIKAILG